jgi:hypothetical protein
LFSDSSAARGFAARKGVGRMRQFGVRHLWLQSEVSSQQVVFWRVAGEANPADLMTKYFGVRDVVKHLKFMNLHVISRSRITAPAEWGGVGHSLGFKAKRPILSGPNGRQ